MQLYKRINSVEVHESSGLQNPSSESLKPIASNQAGTGSQEAKTVWGGRKVTRVIEDCCTKSPGVSHAASTKAVCRLAAAKGAPPTRVARPRTWGRVQRERNASAGEDEGELKVHTHPGKVGQHSAQLGVLPGYGRRSQATSGSSMRRTSSSISSTPPMCSDCSSYIRSVARKVFSGSKISTTASHTSKSVGVLRAHPRDLCCTQQGLSHYVHRSGFHR